MKSFFGGQIKKEHRGDLAAVITREKEKGEYGTFICSINSEDFIHLTGKGAAKRAYIGLNQEAADDAARYGSDLNTGNVKIGGLDHLFVIPHFLTTNVQLPERIVLESSGDEGYRVSEVK